MWYDELCLTTRPLFSSYTGSWFSWHSFLHCTSTFRINDFKINTFRRTKFTVEVLEFSLHTHVFLWRFHMQILISIIIESTCISSVKIKKKIRFTTVMVWKIILRLPFEKLCSQNCKEPLIQIFFLSLSLRIIASVWWLLLCTLPMFVCYLCVFYLCHAKDTQNFYLWKYVYILEKC